MHLPQIISALVLAASGTQTSQTVDYHDMVFVESGSFIMGCTKEQSNDCLSDETKVRVVLDGFWITKYEITNQQFAKFLTSEGNQTEGGAPWYRTDKYALISESGGQYSAKEGFEEYPVSNVSWYGASQYARWLSRVNAADYRLPTEAQWEYAARGGQKADTFIYSGSNTIELVAWCDDYVAGSATGWGFKNDNGTHKVGQKKANVLGIHDMSGNVREWVSDHYENYLVGGENPTGPKSGSLWVRRGGSWDNSADECRVSARGHGEPVNRFSPGDGFRVVRLEQHK